MGEILRLHTDAILCKLVAIQSARGPCGKLGWDFAKRSPPHAEDYHQIRTHDLRNGVRSRLFGRAVHEPCRTVGIESRRPGLQPNLAWQGSGRRHPAAAGIYPGILFGSDIGAPGPCGTPTA